MAGEDDTTMSTDGNDAAGASGQPDAGAASSGDAGDDVSTLRNRYAGQTAKVNALTAERDALLKERDALKAERDQYQKGEIDKDEALKTQLAAKDAELAEVRRQGALERIKGQYPETYKVFGDSIAGFSNEQLAESEARFKVGSEATEPPTPLKHNESRTVSGGDAGNKKREETSEDIKARLLSLQIPEGFTPNA